MENYFTLLFGIVLSCLVYCIILFQFLEERYIRVYRSKFLYMLLEVGSGMIIVFINVLNIPILNIISWVLIFEIITIFFYADYGKKLPQRIFEMFVLILILTICEIIGYIILEFIFWKLDIGNIQPMIMQCLNMIFSKLIILVLYYTLITKLWRKSSQYKFNLSQYIVHFVIIIYSIVNLAVIIIVVSNEMAVSFAERLLLLINMCCIVFADLYLLYFIRFVEENSKLKTELKLLEQQLDMQYQYYAAQEGKYNESVNILHDVNKHLKMIEEIYESDNQTKAKEYAKEIEQMLKPLVVHQYTDNLILNILLNDKKHYASLHGIEFDLEIGCIDLEFMEPVEITTVFGNLLDNAMESCERATGDRRINMKLDTFNDFVVIQIMNSTNGMTQWKNGIPISNKKGSHGIGLINVENVIKKYDGNMLFEEINNVFKCSIIFND